MPPHKKIWMTDLALALCAAWRGAGRRRPEHARPAGGQQQSRRAVEAVAQRLAPGDRHSVMSELSSDSHGLMDVTILFDARLTSQCRYRNSVLLIKAQVMSTQSSRRLHRRLAAPAWRRWLGTLVCHSDSAIFTSSGVGKRERIVRYSSSTISSGLAAGLEDRLELGALLELALDMARIQQVQPLGGDRLVVAFVFHAGGPRRAAEQRQERTGDAAVGDGNRRLVLREYR